MPTALISVNSDFTVTQWNKSAEQLINIKSEAALKKSLIKIFPQFELIKAKIETCIKSGKTEYSREEAITISGEVQFWEITIYPILKKGNSDAVLLINNITEKIKVEELLVQSEKMLSVGGLAAGDGPGIKEKIRKRVFERFFTTKPVGIGTGLGLSISYFIITKDHGGEMILESTPGKGTKFIFTLPQ